MNILIIGSGGREHALAWKATQDPQVQQVYVAPGNAGTAQEHKVSNVAIAASDHEGLVNFAQTTDIALTIVGPEAPLVAGIVDRFQAAGLTIFGPRQAAAQLESSKVFSKQFLTRHGIPTAAYQVCTQVDEAKAYIKQQGTPLVIKADGLAAGKGVILAESEAQACAAVEAMLTDNAFGAAGGQIVLEEYLTGEEASFIVMVDGHHILPLASSQDHKARDNGDNGPNTGGMGAYSPAPVVTAAGHERIMQTIIRPTVAGMAQAGTPYTGFLYAGLMIDAQGNAKALEYNCRLGDPETQPLLMRLTTSLVDLCLAGATGRLDQVQASWHPGTALTVVMAASGYPGSPRTGDRIHGLEHVAAAKVFHAGTRQQDQHIVTHGGRVLSVTALADTVQAAQQQAYQAVAQIHWPGAYYRTDIGHRAIARTVA